MCEREHRDIIGYGPHRECCDLAPVHDDEHVLEFASETFSEIAAGDSRRLIPLAVVRINF